MHNYIFLIASGFINQIISTLNHKSVLAISKRVSAAIEFCSYTLVPVSQHITRTC